MRRKSPSEMNEILHIDEKHLGNISYLNPTTLENTHVIWFYFRFMIGSKGKLLSVQLYHHI